MAFRFRKTVSFIDPGIDDPCKTFCDPSNNLGGICPQECAGLCENACKFLVIPVPPPLPSPEKPDLQDPPSQNHPRFHLFLPIILAVLTASFLIFACCTLYKFYTCWSDSRRRREGPPEDRDPVRDEFLDEDQGPVVDHPIWYIRTVGLQPAVISAITIVRYKKGDGLIDGTDCSVCLSEFEEDETLRLLPKCNHAFHIPCIDTWLRSHTNCPLCRAGIVNNTRGPRLSSSEQNSGQDPVEETRDGGENRAMVLNEESEVRISVIEENVDSRAEKGDNSTGPGGLDGIQGMRRSVSLDYASASIIRSAVANASTRQSDRNQECEIEMKDSILGKSPSIGRSLQIGTSSVKRSVSCSAKLFLSRYTKNSSIPLPQ